MRKEDEDSRFYLLVCLSDGKPSAGPEMGKLLMENTRFESRDWDWALHLSRSWCTGAPPLNTSVRLSGRPSNCSSVMIPIVRTSEPRIQNETWDDFSNLWTGRPSRPITTIDGFTTARLSSAKSLDQIFDMFWADDKSSDLARQGKVLASVLKGWGFNVKKRFAA